MSVPMEIVSILLATAAHNQQLDPSRPKDQPFNGPPKKIYKILLRAT